MFRKIISSFLLFFFCFTTVFSFFIDFVLGEEIPVQTEISQTTSSGSENTNNTEISTGNIIIETSSGVTNISSGSTLETSSGTLNQSNSGSNNSGATQTGTLLEIPDFKVYFQQPTYLLDLNSDLKYLDKETYYCDKSKNPCKVNFNIANLNEKVYSCNIITAFSGTISECNPNTWILLNGENKIKFRVFEKGKESNFKEKNITFYNGETNSGGTNSGSLSNSGTTNTSSGNIDIKTNSGITSSGNTNQTGSVLEVPDFKINFQNPTYLLEKDIEKNNYYCDKNEPDCKVNFKLTTYDSKDISSKFECNLITSFSGIINNCNPNTLILPIGENTIKFKIFEKGNENNFKEKNITFYNGDVYSGNNNSGSLNNSGAIVETYSGTIIESGSGVIQEGNSENSGSGELINYGTTSTGDILEIPDFKINFQSPSYLLEKDLTKNSYECDNSKDDCKVNLKLTTLDGKDFSSKFDCNLITSFSGIINNCNPNTLVLPIGENTIKFKVFEKGNENNFKEKNITFYNNLSTKKSSKIENKNSGSSSTQDYQIKEKESKKIIIQSGLYSDNGKYFCNEEICKVNLKYENSSKEYCEWNFGSGDFKAKYLTTCNPGTIYFKKGIHHINLKIKENGTLSGEKTLLFENIYIKNESNPVAKIKLQGKLTKNKILEGNKLLCLNSEECNVNFSGEDSYDINKKTLKYYWDFGNGESGDTKNPKSITYGSGSFIVKLKVENEIGKTNEDIFLVDVKSKEEQEKLEIDENVFNFLKINRILGNPKGSDDYEWIELINIGDKKINIKGVKIDDIIGSGSKEFEIEENIYLEPGETKKFYKYTTKINLNNSNDEVNILYDNQVIDNTFWDFKLNEGDILSKNGVIENEKENILYEESNELKILTNKFNKKVYSNSKKSIKNLTLWNFKSSKKLASKKEKVVKAKKIKLTQSISKQKKSLKISGITIPNSRVNITLGSQAFDIKSDEKGKYSIKITKLEPGSFEVKTKIFNELGKLIGEKTKELTLTTEYVKSVALASVKKVKVKKSKKAKKIIENDLKVNLLGNKENSDIKEKDVKIDFYLLNTIIGFLSILMLFIIFKRIEYFSTNPKFNNLAEKYKSMVLGIVGEQ